MPGQPVLAKEAVPARDWKRHHYSVPFLELGNFIPSLLDYSHEFMAESDRLFLWKKPIVNVEIRPADRGRCNLQKNVFRMFDSRIGYLIDLDVPRLVKYGCLHVSRFLFE